MVSSPTCYATRLTQDVNTLAVQPASDNVFTAAGSSSVEEYLQQVEESTILAAIQVNAWAIVQDRAFGSDSDQDGLSYCIDFSLHFHGFGFSLQQ